MALSYAEGMDALRAMFPSWDASVLAELLEANDGHLENTIDMALSMEPPASSVRAFEDDVQPPPAPMAFASTSTAASPASASSAYYKSPSSSPRRKSTASSSSSLSRARVTLPDDFLRLPVDHTYDGYELSEQEQRDAIFAEMLQNEIFRQELMQNEEFSAHFNGDRRPSTASRRSSAAAYPEKSASEIASETFNAMSVKFASMSEVMKKKANEMYMRFQTRSDAPAEKDPYSHRPLMADDSSDEEDTNVRQRYKDRASSPSMGGVVRRTSAYASKKNE
uniref:CUE domain-containing protein n=1 Tax=Globisporangium ultimum (strain ATCC 200006 / CBS 805.95 / DAOM BR144) TaxID=431595 RepID=K3WYW1_GLOUD